MVIHDKIIFVARGPREAPEALEDAICEESFDLPHRLEVIKNPLAELSEFILVLFMNEHVFGIDSVFERVAARDRFPFRRNWAGGLLRIELVGGDLFWGGHGFASLLNDFSE
ncbi:MAG: hypothetical protein NTX50_29590 [Candidatus Sumerlaeota bacterium]|nr:hypothetical protein [Candidatus Sumerlaeota bacterium]